MNYGKKVRNGDGKAVRTADGVQTEECVERLNVKRGWMTKLALQGANEGECQKKDAIMIFKKRKKKKRLGKSEKLANFKE